jgi:hypothetical protein
LKISIVNFKNSREFFSLLFCQYSVFYRWSAKVDGQLWFKLS